MKFIQFLLLACSCCFLLNSAPKRRKPKQKAVATTAVEPELTTGGGDEAAAGGAEAALAAIDTTLDPRVAHILDKKQQYLYLNSKEIAEYEAGIDSFTLKIAPKGFRVLSITGKMSRENQGFVKNNQLTSVQELKKTLGQITQNLPVIVATARPPARTEDLSRIFERIDNAFRLLEPKLKFTSVTVSNEIHFKKLLLEIVDFIEAIAWFVHYSQATDPLFIISVDSVLKGIRGMFGIMDRAVAIKNMRKDVSLAAADTLKESCLSELLAPLLTHEAAASSPIDQIQQATRILSEEYGPIMRDFYPDSVRNKALFDFFSLDDTCWLSLAAITQIEDISKKTPSQLKCEIKTKLSLIITTLVFTIIKYLQEQAASGNDASHACFEYYTQESIRLFSCHNPQIKDAFKSKLSKLKEQFLAIHRPSLDFVTDSLKASTDSLLFCLCSRTVLPPPEIVHDEAIANCVEILKRVNRFFKEKEDLSLEKLTPLLHGEIPDRDSRRKMMPAHTRVDVMVIPSYRDERTLPFCEDISQFKLVLPMARMKDLARVPDWMIYITRNFSQEDSFFDSIINSPQMFNYKYEQKDTTAILADLETLCLRYKENADSQDLLLDGRPGLSITRLMAIFSSLKQLICTQGQIPLRIKLDIWNRAMDMNLEITDLLQVEAWLKQIDPSFHGIEFPDVETEEYDEEEES
ncbi:hypothetical protein FJ366_00650 [Candidatus Dependentiae bacterium]|nr:hypothetical protein [Candidatus Dependentiae bacterium]